jgi:hypothetical protein
MGPPPQRVPLDELSGLWNTRSQAIAKSSEICSELTPVMAKGEARPECAS